METCKKIYVSCEVLISIPTRRKAEEIIFPPTSLLVKFHLNHPGSSRVSVFDRLLSNQG